MRGSRKRLNILEKLFCRKITLKILVYETSQHKKDYFALTKAFEDLGHEAKVFDWQSYLYTSNGASLLNRVKDRLLLELVSIKINKELVKDIKESKYDLLVVVRGDFISADTLEYAKTKIPTVVNWSSDDFANPLNTSKCILDCFPIYDCIFTPRQHLASEYLSKGAKSVQMLNWYYRSGLLYTPQQIINVNYHHNVSFIGAWSQYREVTITPLCGFGLRTWGWGWNKKASHTFTAKVDCKPQIGMVEMMHVFATSKVNINILTIENRDTTNLRNFEIPAAGGFQLSERSSEILQLFDEDKEIVCFGCEDELKEKVDYYLKNEVERQKIARQGYQRLISCNHSIVDRAKQILDPVTF